jgi:hypothetical protein
MTDTAPAQIIVRGGPRATFVIFGLRGFAISAMWRLYSNRDYSCD